MLPKRQQIRKIGRKRAVNVAKKATFTGPGTIELKNLSNSNTHTCNYSKYITLGLIKANDTDPDLSVTKLYPYFI